MTIDLPSDLRARVDAARAEMDRESAALPGDDAARQSALTQCQVALTRRALTASEMRGRLAAKEHDPAVISWALERCVEAGIIDDAAYARSFWEQRMRRGHGPRKVQTDLARRGIAPDLIAAARESWAEHAAEDALPDAAVTALERRYRPEQLEAIEQRAKATRWLLGRGFAHADADAAIRVIRARAADAADG